MAALPTIKYLMEQGAKVILCSHLGRPKGEYKPEFSLAPVAKRLSEYLGVDVPLAEDENVVGDNAKKMAADLQDGQVMLLENVRYRAEETKNEENFSKELASLADLFVNDAFGTAHRAHCSTTGVASYLPAACGYLIQKEIQFMGGALADPKRPLVAILGGAKVSDKIGVISNLIDKCDTIIIGGGMAYTFMKYLGHNIGTSLLEADWVDKAGEMIKEDAKVEVRGHDIGYVSRGGLKLEKAMQCFPLTPNGKVCMDIGASTGGFTDCMLQNGAVKVYAVDVGYGQLAWSLRTDERVVNMERTNIRNVTLEDLAEPIEFFSVDVSFISLHHIFPVAQAITTPDAMGVCLVKPQFEAGREKVGKNGVVRDPATHREVLHNAMGYAAANGFVVRGLDFSPVKGPEGNIEYLMFVQKNEQPGVLDDSVAEQVVAASHSSLDK